MSFCLPVLTTSVRVLTYCILEKICTCIWSLVAVRVLLALLINPLELLTMIYELCIDLESILFGYQHWCWYAIS